MIEIVPSDPDDEEKLGFRANIEPSLQPRLALQSDQLLILKTQTPSHKLEAETKKSHSL